MSNSAQSFSADTLVIFIGHSDDAVAEAHAIRGLEMDLQRELERWQRHAQNTLPFKTVRMWEWNYDAPPLVGGQDKVITPAVERANVAVFVFKERIGKITWEELELSRTKPNAPISILVFFPSTEKTAKNGVELENKKLELTADWNLPGSRALRPIEPYNDISHLRGIALEQLKNAIDQVIHAHSAASSTTKAENPSDPPPQEKSNLVVKNQFHSQTKETIMSEKPIPTEDDVRRIIKEINDGDLRPGYRFMAVNKFTRDKKESCHAAELFMGDCCGFGSGGLFEAVEDDEDLTVELDLAAAKAITDGLRLSPGLPECKLLSVNLSLPLLRKRPKLLDTVVAYKDCFAEIQRPTSLIFELPEGMDAIEDGLGYSDIDRIKSLVSSQNNIQLAIDDFLAAKSRMDSRHITACGRNLVWLKMDWKYFRSMKRDEDRKQAFIDELNNPKRITFDVVLEGVATEADKIWLAAQIAPSEIPDQRICIQGFGVKCPNQKVPPPPPPVPTNGDSTTRSPVRRTTQSGQLNSAQLFSADTLVVFIGYSDDAGAEAQAIRELQMELQRELDSFQQVARHILPFKAVKMWDWRQDSLPLVGGPEAMIKPALRRANIAVFVFKERVGEVTWNGLEFSREREGKDAIPVLACFPHNAPENMNDPNVALAWVDLLSKKRSILDGSRALLPLQPYNDVNHLKDIAFQMLKRALHQVLIAAQSDDSTTSSAGSLTQPAQR